MISTWWWLALAVATVSAGALALAARRLAGERRALRRVTHRVREVRAAHAGHLAAERAPAPAPVPPVPGGAEDPVGA